MRSASARRYRPRPHTTDRSATHRVPAAVEQSLAAIADAQRAAARRRVAATARAVRDERLRRIEQDLTEMRGRVNGVLFAVVGTVVAQVIVRLLG